MDESKFLNKYRTFLITSHLSPDGDAIGCEIALYFFLKEKEKEVIVVNDEPVPQDYRFLKGSELIFTPEEFKQKYHASQPLEAAIFLECSSIYRAGWTGKIAKDLPILNIDHHADNSRYGTVNLIITHVSACGEIVYDLIVKSGGTITPEIATALYAAILTDTSKFRFNTRPQTLHITADLIEKGADPNRISEGIYEQASFSSLLLLSKSLATLKKTPDGKVVYCRVSRQMYQETETTDADSENFIDFLRVVKGGKITFVLKELPNGKTRVNLRSKNDYDVQKVAAKFGGGGHRNAAGCTINTDLDSAEKLILEEIKNSISFSGGGE